MEINALFLHVERTKPQFGRNLIILSPEPAAPLMAEDGRIPKDVLYGELASGSRRVGRPALCYKDTCKREMKTCNIDADTLEAVASDRCYCSERGLKAVEKTLQRSDRLIFP